MYGGAEIWRIKKVKIGTFGDVGLKWHGETE